MDLQSTIGLPARGFLGDLTGLLAVKDPRTYYRVTAGALPKYKHIYIYIYIYTHTHIQYTEIQRYT